LEEDLSPVPAAQLTCNSSRKGRKDAKGAKGREDKGEESRNRFPTFSCVRCPRNLIKITSKFHHAEAQRRRVIISKCSV